MERMLKRDREVVDGEDSVAVEETKGRTEYDLLWKRRTIRSQYRNIENRINEGKDEIANGDSEKFMSLMNEVENMHQHVNKPGEQVVDAEALLGLTSTLVASVKTHIGGGITPAEFVSCLIREFAKQKIMKGLSESAPNILWKNISFLVAPSFKNVPGCMTMIGPMKNELKQRKLVVGKRSRLREGKARPKEVEKAAEVATDTDRNVRVMFELLKKEKKVKLKNLMLNRNSFAQTVENLFALSFLVKDGRLRMDVDENGSQIVVPSNGPSAEEIKSGVAKNHQFIFRYDFDDWKLMRNLIAEGEELMPGRDAFSDAAFSKARKQPEEKCFSQAEAISLDSHLRRLAPVKKFSRNYGHTMLNSDLTEIGNGAKWN